VFDSEPKVVQARDERKDPEDLESDIGVLSEIKVSHNRKDGFTKNTIGIEVDVNAAGDLSKAKIHITTYITKSLGFLDLAFACFRNKPLFQHHE
jgi:hypothetical protein